MVPLYEVSKIAKLLEAKNTTVVVWGGGEGRATIGLGEGSC